MILYRANLKWEITFILHKLPPFHKILNEKVESLQIPFFLNLYMLSSLWKKLLKNKNFMLTAFKLINKFQFHILDNNK